MAILLKDQSSDVVVPGHGILPDSTRIWSDGDIAHILADRVIEVSKLHDSARALDAKADTLAAEAVF